MTKDKPQEEGIFGNTKESSPVTSLREIDLEESSPTKKNVPSAPIKN